MAIKLKFSLEDELEINKLLDAEKIANKSGEFDQLYNDLQQNKKVEDTNRTDTDITSDDSNLVSDAGTETDTEEPAEGSSDDSDSIATEEIRNLKYNLVTEDYESVKNFAGNVASHVFSGIQYLAALGIQYGPGIATSVYKGVIFVFSRLAKLLISGIKQLNKYLSRREQSFTSIKNNITSLNKSLELIKTKKEQNDLTGLSYTNQKVINQLKISNITDVYNNISVLETFLSSFINEIDNRIKNDVANIKHIIAYRTSGIAKAPINLMKIKSFDSHLAKGSISGYEANSEFIENFKYNKILPGDVVFIAHLPKEDINTLEDVTSAYNDSSMFFGVNTESYKDINSIDYMTIDKLSDLLNRLDKLVDICIEHKNIYLSIKKTKSNFIINIRNYFLNIAASKEKVSLKDSLVEYVYLKSMFIDKVYLVVAMDIHDYTAKVLVSSLAYCKDNVKSLS